MTKPITQSLLTINGVDLKTPKLIDPPQRTTIGPLPDSLLVSCVWWGNLYNVQYVERLRNMVARNLTIPYEFVCLTDHPSVPEGVTKVPLDTTKTGWWNKIHLFKPGLFGDATRIMYFDLDVVITNNLDKLACVQEEFCMIENFGPNKRHSAHNSSVLVWTPNERSEQIYTKFSPDVTKFLHGDQCYVWRSMHDKIHNYPRNWVVSYKYEKHPQWRFTDKDTSVVVFHGKPKPHEVKDAVIVKNWK